MNYNRLISLVAFAVIFLAAVFLFIRNYPSDRWFSVVFIVAGGVLAWNAAGVVAEVKDPEAEAKEATAEATEAEATEADMESVIKSEPEIENKPVEEKVTDAVVPKQDPVVE